MKLKEFIELNVLNEIKCYILITFMYMPNTCRLIWNKNYMLSEISVKVFRSGRKLVGPAETDIVQYPKFDKNLTSIGQYF